MNRKNPRLTGVGDRGLWPLWLEGVNIRARHPVAFDITPRTLQHHDGRITVTLQIIYNEFGVEQASFLSPPRIRLATPRVAATPPLTP